ncbi:MAG: exodeoxyribonuclease V subunit gamma [Gammaproteobacteria bacterium]|nr:exodeoxyribonuclease V subunit gamma [Gammaproteobacteria bacterium]
MLNVVYSNDMMHLAAQLAELQQRDPLPPLIAETVIVQSNELARWLSLYLAKQHGVASHIEFPYPSAYIWALFRQVLPNVPQQSAFSTDAMAWRIFALLPDCCSDTDFAIVKAYLGEQDDAQKRFALAYRIADIFDQYLMYRPHWLDQWEQGQTPHWQAKLWQKLTAGEALAMHRANLLQQLNTFLTTTQTRPEGLPQRLAIFGISALPPVYLKLFELMARHCDITLFFLSPSQEYWGDLTDLKTQAKKRLASDNEDDYFSTGHPLLASLGKQGQAFFEQLQEAEHVAIEAFYPPETNTLLGQLQYDIFSLTDRTLETDKVGVAADDTSIMVHSCHSAMREIEVLHDQLLALFEHNPDLSPTDVVVMTPDIEIYAPWIDAVFGNASSTQSISYGIADCGIRYQSTLINAFISLLGLPQSRFDSETIIGLLECDAIQQRFSIETDQLSLIRQWLRDTHIRWGLSAQHKAEFDLPETENNTWRAGLDRLLLGYAMPLNEQGQATRLFDQQLAFDGITGDRASLMARLCAFVDDLDEIRVLLKANRTPMQWQVMLNNMLERLFDSRGNDAQDSELILIRQTIDKCVETTQLAQFEQTISLALLKDWLTDHIETSQTVNRFMGHGVTFCGMVPMRSIPFQVVCLIGMNDASYPRQQPIQGFDLLSKHFERGDRSRRDDDRYLFLEALLSCKRHLYISYVGASIRDNAPIPPSVLVSDLRDLINQSFSTEQGQELWEQLLTKHPLQAFSQRYFNNSDPTLFSFDQAQCPISHQQQSIDWFAQALPPADDDWRYVSLGQLINFYKHPARFLLRQRLGLRLELADEQLEVREPFDLDDLDAWHLRQQLLQARLNKHDTNDDNGDALALAQASGVLPQGTLGQQIFDKQVERVERFSEQLLPHYPSSFIEAMPFEVKVDDFVITGQFEHLSDKGIFVYRMAKTKGHDLVGLWLEHLLLNIVQPKGVLTNSEIVTDDNHYQFKPVDEPMSYLKQLLDFYWQGLHQPLAFFNNTSYAYAKASLNDGRASPETAIKASWFGNQHVSGEADDVYHQQLYTRPPLDQHFQQLALAIYEPIQAHLVAGVL